MLFRWFFVRDSSLLRIRRHPDSDFCVRSLESKVWKVFLYNFLVKSGKVVKAKLFLSLLFVICLLLKIEIISILTSRQSHTQAPVTESQKVELYGMCFVSLHTMLQIVEFIVQFNWRSSSKFPWIITLFSKLGSMSKSLCASFCVLLET